MATAFEDLKVLKVAESLADSIWKKVVKWDQFPQGTVGQQLARAADSVGANIAEAFGRFHYSEKLQFLYYARGSLFETKYWLNRAFIRGLLPAEEVKEHAEQLTHLARQLNSFANSLKDQRANDRKPARALRERRETYLADDLVDGSDPIVSDAELAWLYDIGLVNQSPFSNL
jgi:four helix bundle protein